MNYHAKIYNNGDSALNQLKLQAKIYELGVWGSTGKFTLQIGQETGQDVYVFIPEDAQEGLYLVKVTAGNDTYHTVGYRLIRVVNNT